MALTPSLDLPRSAWLAVARWTGLVTLGSVIISALASTALLGVLAQGINGPGLAASIIMPILLGGPTMFYLSLGRQKLKHANAQLQVLASTDWLTGCLNRRAFTDQVTAALASTGGAMPPHGALLIIDADHFKTINDRYGHERGDEALQLIAAAIKRASRSGDIVGRLGGEEFGVFLARADAIETDAVAEHIRWSVAAIDFPPARPTRYP